jgi:hypothetical protein
METVVLASPHFVIIPPCLPTIASVRRPVLLLALGRAIVYLLAFAAFLERSGLCIALLANFAREGHFRCRGDYGGWDEIARCTYGSRAGLWAEKR